jgi:hypothetical protein
MWYCKTGRRYHMRKKPIILTRKERATLERYCSTGVHDVRLVTRAKIVLALDTSGEELRNGKSV